PLNVTVPGAAPKFEPLIMTHAFTGPEVGERPVMVGATRTVNTTPLLSKPFAAVTTTAPVVAVDGTVALMLVAPQPPIAAAGVPANVTPPGAFPKFAPVIVTAVPTGPDAGDRLVM